MVRPLAHSDIPGWILIFSGILSLLGLFVGISLYISPGTFIKVVNFAAAGTMYITKMWAARQVAIAAVIGAATVRRSPVMLRTGLLIYCLMNLQDILIGLHEHDKALASGAAVFFLLSGVMTVMLLRRERRDAPGGRRKPA